VTDSATVIRCAFYARRARPDGTADYDPISVASYFHDGNLATLHPPLEGDQVLLWDKTGGKWVSYRILRRAWRPVEYGSYAWPHNQQVPPAGDHLDIVVEVCEGLFEDEADDEPDPEPETASALRQPPGSVQFTVHHQVGLGGAPDLTTPECPVCWAWGGGGHGGFCPNAGKPPAQWVNGPPPGYSRPPRPERPT
jgi:hypothetical protein